MTTIVEVNHNSGPPVSNHWNNITDTGVRLSITGAAGLNSTAFGLQVGADGSNTASGDVNMSTPGSNQFRLRVRVDEGTFDFAGSDGNLFTVAVSAGGNDVAQLTFGKTGSALRVFGSWDIDGGGNNSSGNFSLAAGENCVEVSTVRNGAINLYINGVNQYSSTITNTTMFGLIDRLRFFASTTPGGNTGNLYFDEILTDDSASAVLCPLLSNFDIITHGRGASALLFNQQAAPTLDNTFAFVVVEDTAGGQIRYLKMDLPVKDVTATPMVEVHTDATDTDGMVTTAASAVKMFFAGDDGVGGFVESHAVLTGVTTDLYSNAARAINAMTASPGLSSEAIILESAVSNEELRHTIDDFVATQATNNLSGFLNFIDSSIGVIFFKTPEKPNLEDCQAFVVGTDPSGGVNQVAWFVQLMTGANIVIVDEAIAALQNAAMITGIGIGA